MKARDKKEETQFGYEAITHSGKCGMPKLHMIGFQNAAKKLDTPILIRPVSPAASYFLERGYPTKDFNVKMKSSKIGIAAGLIVKNAEKYSHIIGEENYIHHKKDIDKAFKTDKKEHADDKSNNVIEINLVLSEDRIKELLDPQGLNCAIEDKSYSNDFKRKFTWKKEDGVSIEAYAKPSMNNPQDFEFFEDESCQVPIVVIGKTVVNKEGVTESRPFTADYDLFAIPPRWTDVNQRTPGDTAAEWRGIYQIVPFSQYVEGKSDAAKLYIEAATVLDGASPNENSPFLKCRYLDKNGTVKESTISQKELKIVFASSNNPDLQKILDQKDPELQILNKHTLKIIDILSKQGHIDQLSKNPVDKRPFRVQGNNELNKTIVEQQDKEGYEGPKEHDLQGNVSTRIQSAIPIINKEIEEIDPLRKGTIGLKTVHHNDESGNPFAVTLKQNMPILLFLPHPISLGLTNQTSENEPVLIQNIQDLQHIRKSLQNAGYYWAAHSVFEELKTFNVDTKELDKVVDQKLKTYRTTTSLISQGLGVTKEKVIKITSTLHNIYDHEVSKNYSNDDKRKERLNIIQQGMTQIMLDGRNDNVRVLNILDSIKNKLNTLDKMTNKKSSATKNVQHLIDKLLKPATISSSIKNLTLKAPEKNTRTPTFIPVKEKENKEDLQANTTQTIIPGRTGRNR